MSECDVPNCPARGCLRCDGPAIDARRQAHPTRTGRGDGVKGTLLQAVGPARAGDAVTVTDECECIALGHEDHRIYAIRDDRWQWPVGYLCGRGVDGVVAIEGVTD